jgi:1,4-dihydroxy-2-naphthoyl-CoA synthase
MNNIRRGLPLTSSRIEKIFPKLTPAQVSRIAAHGHVRSVQSGEVLIEQGDKSVPFFVVITGEVEIVRPCGAHETLVTVHGSGEFTGEVNMLSGRRSLIRARAIKPCKVIELDHKQMLTLVQTDAELSDILMRAFILRRVELELAVNGFALGGGCEAAMACTIRVAAENAKFGQPEVTLGIIPGGGGTQRLPRLVGKGRALQLILSGEMINAQEAYRIGLVNEVVPAADLIPRAEAILNHIFKNAPIAVKYSLEAVNKGLETSIAEGLSLEASLFGICAATEDKKEGTQAFLQKRHANFKGE